MLSIGVMAAGQGGYYTRLAREDYYTEGGEPAGKWCGRGAARLRLAGQVQAEQLAQLLKGFGPEGAALIQNAGDNRHQPGWDLTFSAPKSVSVLWSQADEATRRVIQEAHHAAVLSALGYLEEEASYSRRGRGGTSREPAELMVATFEHGTSRALDPQLHTHALVANVAVREDGTTGTLLSKPLYGHKMAAGAIYRAELASQLSERLGVVCVREKSWFELSGVSAALCAEFSKRRQAIEELLKGKGLETAAAAAMATLSTREKKTLVPPRSELFPQWQALGRTFGFDAQAVLQTPGRPRNPIQRADAAVTAALVRLTESQSHFSQRDLVRMAAEEAQNQGINAREIRTAVSAALKDRARVISLGNSGHEPRYTTPDVLALEKQLIKDADALHRERRHGVADRDIENTVERYATKRSETVEALRHHAAQLKNAARKKPTKRLDPANIKKNAERVISREQAEAVYYLTMKDGGSVRFLEGWAGTGKTSTLFVARELWEKAGYQVVGVTLSGKAAKELHNGAGIESYSAAMLNRMMHPTLGQELRHHAHQILRAAVKKPTFRHKPFRFTDKMVLVIDEAGMLATSQMARLIRDAREAGAWVIAAFDRRQLQAIGPGGASAFLADRYGKAELETIVRQRDPRDIQAVKDMAEGRAAQALKNLSDRGLLHVEEDRAQAIEKLVADWTRDAKHRRDRTLIFVSTNEDAATLNQRCQAQRIAGGELDPRRSTRFDEQRLCSGDRVLFTKNSRTVGVKNGETGTIIDIRSGLPPLRQASLTVKLDTGEKVSVPRRYKDVRLGYAVTTHKAQGSTVDNAYVLAGGSMQDREISYVQASRARLETRVYTDAQGAGPEMQELLRQMTTSHEKTLAHAELQKQSPQGHTLVQSRGH